MQKTQLVGSKKMDIEEEYQDYLEDGADKLNIDVSKIKILFSEKEIGGRVSEVKLNKGNLISATLILGSPYNNNEKERKNLVFHELGHLVFFQYLSKEYKLDYEETMNLLLENLQLVPWSEVIAEFISGRYGKLESYVLSKKFENWRWWKNEVAYEFSKECVRNLFEEISVDSVHNQISKMLKQKNISRMNKLLKLMEGKSHD